MVADGEQRAYILEFNDMWGTPESGVWLIALAQNCSSASARASRLARATSIEDVLRADLIVPRGSMSLKLLGTRRT